MLKQKELKESIKEEYKRNIRKILETKLNEQNVIMRMKNLAAL